MRGGGWIAMIVIGMMMMMMMGMGSVLYYGWRSVMLWVESTVESINQLVRISAHRKSQSFSMRYSDSS